MISMSYRLLISAGYENIFMFRDRESFEFQRDLFKQVYKKAKTKEQKENVMMYWNYVKRGLVSYDLEQGQFVFSKKA
jgi:hypothetical protein